jgi:large subunit ribosomal protein L2
MLLEYDDKEKIYQIAPQGLNVGDEIICDEKTEVKTGNRMKIKNIPVGTFVYNIELEPDRGGKLVRSAGTGAKILAHGDKYTDIEMPSKEIRKILNECYASIGMISFPEWKYINIKKAGTKRLMGIRPTVRGSAMNPVDHPHGGGEGRAPIGLKYPKTPWGKHALGKKTRNKKKWTNKLIIKRRK